LLFFTFSRFTFSGPEGPIFLGFMGIGTILGDKALVRCRAVSAPVKRNRMKRKAGIIVLAVAGMTGGCFTPDPKSLTSDSAPSAIPAIKDAGTQKDRKAIPRLIVDLDDADSAIRFAAITALTKITGLTFDYRYYDDFEERKPAVQRWQQWLKANPVP
jgi:hypothetical protein